MSTWKINGKSFQVFRGDITQQSTDAVVNAANKELAPGGGVAGAIHRKAGEQLWQHCQKLGGCQTGEAILTPGFHLPAPYIIHTVGPVYSMDPHPAELLKQSYQTSLQVAEENGLKSIAFPLLSSGAFGYPVREASQIAIQAIENHLKDNQNQLEEVRMVLFGEKDHSLFTEEANRLLKEASHE